MSIILVFRAGPGLRLRIPAEFEAKHYSTDDIAQHAEHMAKCMGVVYSHWEDAQ